MNEDLIKMGIENSQRVLIVSIGNRLFELYLSSYEVNDLEFGRETIVNLSIEQYLLSADDNGTIEWFMCDDEVVSKKKKLSCQKDTRIDEMVKMVAQEAIIFTEEFCKEVSLHYYTL